MLEYFWYIICNFDFNSDVSDKEIELLNKIETDYKSIYFEN